MRGSDALVPPGAMLMPDVYRQLAMLASVASNPRGTAAGLVEVFLFGPRLVVGAVRQSRQARRLRGVDRARAAAVVEQLLKVHGGIDVARLLRPGEDPTDIVPPLTWLALEGWIGVNHEGDRAWLTPDGRAALTR